MALVLMCAVLMCQCGAGEANRLPERATHEEFDVRVYLPPGAIRHLVLLISGDGGWGESMSGIARGLTADNTLVAGIDGARFLRALERGGTGCASPAQRVLGLAGFLRERYHLPREIRPLLVGHSAGATLAYVALAQAPADAFSGALTLSFCTELDLRRPLCPADPLRGTALSGGFQLRPGGALPAPWIAVHGLGDQVCPADAGEAFTRAIPNAIFIGIPGVDHGYRARERWWGAFEAGARRLLAPRPARCAGNLKWQPAGASSNVSAWTSARPPEVMNAG